MLPLHPDMKLVNQINEECNKECSSFYYIVSPLDFLCKREVWSQLEPKKGSLNICTRRLEEKIPRPT